MSAETFNQINEQLQAQEGQAAAATVLVERSDGTIDTGQLTQFSEKGARVYFANLNSEADGRAMDTRVVAAEALTDESQEQLAKELAGVALLSADARSEQNVAPFDPEIANLKRGIRDALAEKAKAQREGRGDESIYWGQQAGKYTLGLREKQKRQ